MSGPFTAGERLAPTPGGGLQPQPSRQPKPKSRLSGLVWAGRLAGALLGFVFLVAMIGAVVAYGAYRHFAADLPDVDGLRSYQPRVMSRVYADDARPIAELATERRIFVPYPAIPVTLKNAFVAAEDQNFWQHRGVDPLAIARAAITNLQQMGNGRRPIGASTITQQVAKNMLLGNEVSLARKAKEAILALRIEETLSKERILELYLNEIYLGLQSYGVAAAAQAYFNKPLDELTLPESAFLAALPKAPNNYNPFRYPDAAKARRDWVLDRMVEVRAISAAEAAEAKATPIVPSQFRRPEPVPGADWFAEEVRRQLVGQFGPDSTTQGGLMVRTSFDPVLQAAAVKALHDGLMAYDRRMDGWRGVAGHLNLAGQPLRTGWQAALARTQHPPGMKAEWRLAVVIEESDRDAKVGWLERDGPPGALATARTGALALSDMAWARPVRDGRIGGSPRRMADVAQAGDLVMIEPSAAGKGERVTLRQIPAVQGALVSMDPATGRVLAMVGGWSFEQSQFNRTTQAIRQPGSSFKPFVYLTALEQGVSPSWRFQDAPLTIGDWSPSNYGGTFSGPTSLHTALEKSMNLVTIRVAQKVGMEAVAQNAIAFHVVDNMPRVLPASLGAVDTTVLRMAGAYASLAQGGKEVVPSLIDSVQDRDGHVVWRSQGYDCPACADPAMPPEMGDARKQIADPESVFQILTMMQAVVQNGTGHEAGKGIKSTVAGKTGTTQDFNDAWFVGFTPDLVTAVWIGYDSPTSLGEDETGGAIAAPIWRNFMIAALKDRPVLTGFPMPPGMTLVKWDGRNLDAFKQGQTPGDWGPNTGGGGATASAKPAFEPSAGGVDSSMGGLY